MLGSFSNEFAKLAFLEEKHTRKGTEQTRSLAAFKRALKPGDIILAKANAQDGGDFAGDVFQNVINAYDLVTGTKHPGWLHSALYAGDGKVIHFNDKKLARRKKRSVLNMTPQVIEDTLEVFPASKKDLLLLRPKVTGEQAQRAVGRLKARVGEKWAPRSYIKNLVRAGVLPEKKERAATTGDLCTGYIGWAYGPEVKFTGDRASVHLRPKDLVESKKVDHVLAFSLDKTAGLSRFGGTRMPLDELLPSFSDEFAALTKQADFFGPSVKQRLTRSPGGMERPPYSAAEARGRYRAEVKQDYADRGKLLGLGFDYLTQDDAQRGPGVGYLAGSIGGSLYGASEADKRLREMSSKQLERLQANYQTDRENLATQAWLGGLGGGVLGAFGGGIAGALAAPQTPWVRLGGATLGALAGSLGGAHLGGRLARGAKAGRRREERKLRRNLAREHATDA